MITKEEAKSGLRKAGYYVVDDNSVITVLIQANGNLKKTVSDVRELLYGMDYHASFSVKQIAEAVTNEEEEESDSALQEINDVGSNDGDMDMILDADGVQMSLEDLGMNF
ncbi:MAG: hypothetical protein J5525_06100 [Lachnospiraceae bacterium]|nr:hypothetical protein [Lachnospiraceae bacterium]